MEEDIGKTVRKERDTEEIAKKAENTGTWIPEEDSTVMRACIMNTCIGMVDARMKHIAAGMNSTTDAMEDIR